MLLLSAGRRAAGGTFPAEKEKSPGCPQIATGFIIVTRSQGSKITPLKFFYKVVGVNVNAGDADAELQGG